MEWSVFIAAIRDLGVPIAVAAVLVWHFIHMNKALQSHNTKLLEELSRLREEIERIAATDSQGERLLKQSEAMARIVEAKDKESQFLLRLLVEAQIGKPSQIVSAAEGRIVL